MKKLSIFILCIFLHSLFAITVNAQFSNRLYNSIPQFLSLELDNNENIIVSSIESSTKTILIKNDASNQNVLWHKELIDGAYHSFTRRFQDNIYVISNIYSTPNLSVILTKLDLNGNYLWSKSIKTNTDLSIYSMLVINQTKDIFLGFANCGYSNSILKLDSLGNFNWCKMYPPTNGFGASVNDLKEDSQGNILTLSRCILNSNLQVTPFLFTIDLNGNVLWNKFYPSSPYNGDRISSLTVDSKKNIYFRNDLYNNSQVYKNSIFKTDSIGNLQWSKYYTFPYLENSISGGLTIDSNDNLYYMGDGSDTLFSQNRNFNFLKINSTNGAVINSFIDTGYISTLLIPQHLKSSNTNKIIFAGIKNGIGLIASVDSLANGICEFFPSNVISNSVSTTQMIGSLTIVPKSPSISDTVLTINSIFIASNSFCVSEVGINELSNSNILLYPNPSNSNITIDLGEIKQKTKITLTNSLGQVLLTENYASTSFINLIIDAPKGIYFLQIETDKGESRTIKVLKE